MLFTVAPEVEIPVVFETSKVAMSALALGTVAGVQLAGVFQSLLVGLELQVALPANARCANVDKLRTAKQSDSKRANFFIL